MVTMRAMDVFSAPRPGRALEVMKLEELTANLGRGDVRKHMGSDKTFNRYLGVSNIFTSAT